MRGCRAALECNQLIYIYDFLYFYSILFSAAFLFKLRLPDSREQNRKLTIFFSFRCSKQANKSDVLPRYNIPIKFNDSRLNMNFSREPQSR